MPEKASKEKFKSVPSPYLQKEIEGDVRENLEKFRDPVVLATIAFKLLEERENTNRILKNVLARLDKLEAGKEHVPPQDTFLSEIDQKIVDFVRESGKSTARDVQKKFGYRGSNAASSRLNKLAKQGVLEKKQVGKKMYFLLR
jgi:predicted HTH transcriptional regulator